MSEVDSYRSEGSGAFENGFVSVERAAHSLQEAARAVQRSASALAKAATTGDLAKLHTEAERLGDLGDAVRTASRNAASAWPYSEDAEEAYLAEGYETELERVAATRGAHITRYGRGFSAFPCLVVIEPGRRVARINRRRVRALRPSALMAEIEKAQSSKPRFKPDQFIEVLCTAYRLVVGAENIGRGSTLVDVYEALTLLPEARRDYSRDEFLRDVHLLSRSGVNTTKKGFVLDLPASTGTKTKANLLEIVDELGERHIYFGIRFEEVRR